MTKEEIGYLQGVSKPKITIEYREIKGEFIEKSYIPVHGIELITIEKKDIDFIKKQLYQRMELFFLCKFLQNNKKKMVYYSN